MTEEEFYLEDLKSKFRKLKNVGGYDKYYLTTGQQTTIEDFINE